MITLTGSIDARTVERVLRRGRLLAAAALASTAALTSGCGGASAARTATAARLTSSCSSLPARAVCRVLFIGNSYTYVNDLPGMFAKLAASAHRSVATGMLATGGATLADHVASPGTAVAVGARRWNAVVLQEQSGNPAVEGLRRAVMYPAARTLVALVRSARERALFYLTPAHRDGWPEQRLPDYFSMQSAVDFGYLTIARELGVPVVPAGAAWSAVVAGGDGAGLWQADGSHPTVIGTYLTACVFYAALLGRSARGLPYHASLPAGEAARLQAIATRTVQREGARWGLG
ncbi:MAG TPA: SGNH/GDSL hydrolase family protein [Solirubrobacteraceae bacterium]